MANREHLARLKKGFASWNQWRQEMPSTTVNLGGADLQGADLTRADLTYADLAHANLAEANLTHANLTDADLTRADLTYANLTHADLTNANLAEANLTHANLTDANLTGANLTGADLTSADLTRADLTRANLTSADFTRANLTGADLTRADLTVANLTLANLTGADLTGADFWQTVFNDAKLDQTLLTQALLGETIFANVNLSTAVGLETCIHESPSILDFRTLTQSGPLPLPFLRGCGLPDTLIEYLPSLLNQAIQFYSCFISYSTKDQDFADRLHADLQNKGIRCWFAPHDLKSGQKLHEQLDRAIHLRDRLLLLLSPASMNSAWVQHEIATARAREAAENRQVLFPIALVDYRTLRDWKLFDADRGKDTAREIREYFIPDFSNWKDHDTYTTQFNKLVDSLKSSPTT